MKERKTTSETGLRILGCAENLFAEQGYHGTSTRQIAARAGISIQTLHYHCGSKQNLYNLILERSVVPVTGMINRHIQKMLSQDLDDDAALKASLGRLIDELFEVLHRNPHFPLLFFRQWLEQNSELRRVEWERLMPYLRRWREQVESKSDESRRRGIDLPLTFISLSFVYWGLFTNPAFIGGLVNIDGASSQYLERLKAHAKEMTWRLLGRGAKMELSERKKGDEQGDAKPKKKSKAPGKKSARKNPGN